MQGRGKGEKVSLENFERWAELEKIPVFLGPPPTTPAGRKRRADALALALYDGDESPPVTMPIWQQASAAISQERGSDDSAYGSMRA